MIELNYDKIKYECAAHSRPETRERLFRLFFSNPDGEYYLREWERLLETPVSMIRKELLLRVTYPLSGR